MFRFKGKITYDDGLEETFSAGNVALAAWERYAMRNKLPMGKDSPPTLSSLVIAHHALRIEAGFETWLEHVEGVELEADEPAVPPTLAEASTG